jgi:acetoin:2,6-dichlorophenolindophenol oxidoreductase subunit alpha
MEERLGQDFHAGRLPGGVHLYIGQEAIAAGVCEHLGDSDWITSSHRGHGHFLAKGGSPRKMMAEIHAKRTGICGGMGGSMHVADLSKGILGANGIVAGGMGISAGAALAAQLEGKGNVAVCFFGDGAANQGVLMETMNISALWRLPLVLVCENNGFCEFSPTATVTVGRIADRALPFGIPSVCVDGNDALAIWEEAGRAIDHARTGHGPYFLEATTYRQRGHLEAESSFLTGSYRSDDEIDQWKGRDPVVRMQADLRLRNICTEDELATMEREILETVEDAVRNAEADESPDPDHVFDMMFAGRRP